MRNTLKENFGEIIAFRTGFIITLVTSIIFHFKPKIISYLLPFINDEVPKPLQIKQIDMFYGC